MHARSKGSVKMPIVIRIPFGGGIGAVEHHSESPEAYFAHTPGLKVVACSNPTDAYFMIQQAIAVDDPVIFFEPKRRYWEKGDVDTGATPDPLWQARVARPGRRPDAAGLRPDGQDLPRRGRRSRGGGAVARGRRPALAVAAGLRDRSAHPYARTKRCVVVHEAPSHVGLGAELAARLSEELYYEMEAPVLRVTGYDTPYPPSRLEEEYLPDLDRVLHAVDRSLAY